MWRAHQVNRLFLLFSAPFLYRWHSLGVLMHTQKKHTEWREERTIHNLQLSSLLLETSSLFSVLCSFFLSNEWGRNQKTEKYLRLSPSNQHDLSLMLGHIHTMPAALPLTFIGLSCEGGRGNCEKHEWRQESRDYFQLIRSSKYKIACKVIERWTWSSLFF